MSRSLFSFDCEQKKKKTLLRQILCPKLHNFLAVWSTRHTIATFRIARLTLQTRKFWLVDKQSRAIFNKQKNAKNSVKCKQCKKSKNPPLLHPSKKTEKMQKKKKRKNFQGNPQDGSNNYFFYSKYYKKSRSNSRQKKKFLSTRGEKQKGLNRGP